MKHYTIFLHQTPYDPKKGDKKTETLAGQAKLDDKVKQTFLTAIEPLIKAKDVKLLKDALVYQDAHINALPLVRIGVDEKKRDEVYNALRVMECVQYIDADVYGE
jgi:hypothetical protein